MTLPLSEWKKDLDADEEASHELAYWGGTLNLPNRAWLRDRARLREAIAALSEARTNALKEAAEVARAEGARQHDTAQEFVVDRLAEKAMPYRRAGNVADWIATAIEALASKP
jgi:hypothetical protein